MKINHSIVHTLNTNIYNPLNNIKFTKKRKSEKKNIVLNFLKVKYHTKRKRKNDIDKSLHTLQSKY